ncbi:hypothetical protein AB1Y20_010534 [Prymnesium parvum]|uniref:AB hydrolase-1 domain-containing protein n=1 Tax=Prymnesium parvum TaxID=97485 RepID=A0AB34IR22_PRYPA
MLLLFPSSPPTDRSLPAWLPAAAAEISNPAARRVLQTMRRVPISVRTSELDATIHTSFWRTGDAPPKLCFLHGADSSCLEWRHVAATLGARGVDCTAVDWWSGGWTERLPIQSRLADRTIAAAAPWTLVRQHLRAFLLQELGPDPVVLVGASLGGAVAIDFATSYPEAVRGLVLVDAGGESYKAPPPEVVRALAPAALAVKSFVAWVQASAPSESVRIGALHRSEPGWREAYAAYLASGGYACQVGPELIRTVSTPTLVVWGADDPILPVSDAYAFQRDLGANCVGVCEVPKSGHTPHLDQPEEVVECITRFLKGLAPEANVDTR